MNLPAPQFQAVQEPDEFLHLFPHRFDFIYAEHPDPGDRPDWKTENRHPLSDRRIQQGTYLHGVRFGKQTHYLMLDIDPGSPYHPSHDPFAIHRIVAALESLGLVEAVAISSSYRNGIHLYLPFPTPQTSWAIAQATSTLLENAGCKLKPGQLELFPNPRPYSDSPSLYAAHRLPMQAGSYLLNSDFQPIFGDQTTFVQHWTFAQQRNEIDRCTLERILKQAKRKRYKLSGKAEKFLNDLNTEIESGWTDSGQTNHLLGRIAMRAYIFDHIRLGSEPLTGEALATAICQVARSLPGFDTYCNHQADLEQRARFYARSVQTSHYYPFGYKNQPKTPLPELPKPTEPSWNQQQSQAARDRIRQAITDLLNQNTLPPQPTARRQAIRAYGIGNQTLDKYKELWHPKHLKLNQDSQYHPIEEPTADPKLLEPNQKNQYHPVDTNKFVTNSAAPQGQADGLREGGGCGGFSIEAPTEAIPQQVVRAGKRLAKMQIWLESDDPILVAEAQQFFTATVQKETVSSVELNETNLERVFSDPREEASMPGGFGVSQPKRRGGKTSLKEIRQLSDAAKTPVQEQRDLAMQAEVEGFFAQYQQEHPDELALAWSAGVYNPLVGMEDTHARLLTPEEEDWLGLAKAVGWLQVEEDELDAIYFTAPPPEFALEQADWYVRPDLTTFLESPVLLREVVQQFPIPEASIRGAITQKATELGWQANQLEQFIQELFEKPATTLESSDWSLLLFELQLQEG